jgi:hypothetical protein
MKLRYLYQEKLRDFNCCQEVVGQELAMAKFVREVAQKTSKNSKGQISETAVWKSFLHKNGKSINAKSYDDTQLKKFIENCESKIEKYQSDSESAAEDLITFIKDKKFQKHLLKAHCRLDKNGENLDYLTPEEAQMFYEVKPGGQGKLRDLDHIAALLTENLSATEKGMEFLATLVDENSIVDLEAFAKVWENVKKIKEAGEGAKEGLEPVGKFLYNIMPVLTKKIQSLVVKEGIHSIDGVLKNAELKKIFNFLDKKFDTNITGYMKDKAVAYGVKAKNIIKNVNNGVTWKKSLSSLQDSILDPAKDKHFASVEKKYESIETLKGVWLNISFSMISFCVATAKIVSDYKEAKVKDWLGAVNELTSLAKTLAQTYQTSLTATSFDFAGKEAAVFTTKAKTAGQCVKGLGVVASFITVLCCIPDIAEGVERNDLEVIILNSIGLGIALGGVYAAIVESAMLSGVLAVAGLLLAIIMAVVLDPPVIDYFEDTEWGKNQNGLIPIKETIKKFYEKMFKLRIWFEENDYDKTQSCIKIESGVLADSAPVFIQLIHKKSGKAFPIEKIFPGNPDAHGKGKILKDEVSWSEGWPFYPKRIHVFNAWEIWPINNGEKYTIKAGIDPEAEDEEKLDKMALKGEASDIEFDFYQDPQLQEMRAGFHSYWGDQVTIQGGNTYFHYQSNGKIILNVYTRHAQGCQIDVNAKDSGYISSPLISSVKNIAVQDDHSIIPIVIIPPPRNDTYDLVCDISLKRGSTIYQTASTPPLRITQ